ncbi:MAG: TetR/AcrR family transcriptional regulator [Allosphingosinicella sp.]
MATSQEPFAQRRRRVSRIAESRWIEAALTLLADGGVDAVKVEALAEGLGVTKGAFYVRYGNRDELLLAMLDYWRRESTIAVLDAFGALNETPAERLQRVLLLPFRRPDVKERARMEMGIRIWAYRDPRPAATMREVDAHRLRYFQSVLEANGFPPAEAEARAFLIYAYVIADGTLPGERSEVVRAHCRDLLSGR